uniref:Uncharacterized protein n=1 Tax=Arundo donax TaxID=35708 RepID=A0A0A9ETJ2_ARUDO
MSPRLLYRPSSKEEVQKGKAENFLGGPVTFCCAYASSAATAAASTTAHLHSNPSPAASASPSPSTRRNAPTAAARSA